MNNTQDKQKHIIRLKKLEGQVRGLQRMVEEGKYCIDIITQTTAVRNALRSFEDTILEEHLKTCALTQMNSGEEDKAINEILKVYKLKK
jgi:DNA-binding FrmR family transcriptional regulator